MARDLTPGGGTTMLLTLPAAPQDTEPQDVEPQDADSGSHGGTAPAPEAGTDRVEGNTDR